MNDIRQILERATNHPIFGKTARIAITLIDEEKGSMPISHGKGNPQSSKEFAKTYAIRRNAAYFGKKKVYGLNETIELLDSSEREVCLSYVQMEKALISIWSEEPSQSICGLLVIESAS